MTERHEVRRSSPTGGLLVDLKVEINESGKYRPCGRPTKAKQPCKQRTSLMFAPACQIHCTEEELTVARFADRVRHTGWSDGYESGRNSAQAEVEQLKGQLASMREADDARRRVFRDGAGNQLVEVEGYAYKWTGKPDLQVGDEVVLPPSWVQTSRGESSWSGKVTAQGSTYTGATSTILRAAEKPTDRVTPVSA